MKGRSGAFTAGQGAVHGDSRIHSQGRKITPVQGLSAGTIFRHSPKKYPKSVRRKITHTANPHSHLKSAKLSDLSLHTVPQQQQRKLGVQVGVTGWCCNNRADSCSNSRTKRRGSGSQHAAATTA